MKKIISIVSIVFISLLIVQCSKSVPSVPKKIIIKGEVLSDNYEKGVIRIRAFDSTIISERKILGYIDVPQPGPFTLYIPVECVKKFLKDKMIIFLCGFVDTDSTELLQLSLSSDPNTGFTNKNDTSLNFDPAQDPPLQWTPVIISDNKITNVILHITKPQEDIPLL